MFNKSGVTASKFRAQTQDSIGYESGNGICKGLKVIEKKEIHMLLGILGEARII
jgi:hypothetical protein